MRQKEVNDKFINKLLSSQVQILEWIYIHIYHKNVIFAKNSSFQAPIL